MNFSPALSQKLDLFTDFRQHRLQLRPRQAVVRDDAGMLTRFTQRDLRLALGPDGVHMCGRMIVQINDDTEATPRNTVTMILS